MLGIISPQMYSKLEFLASIYHPDKYWLHLISTVALPIFYSGQPILLVVPLKETIESSNDSPHISISTLKMEMSEFFQIWKKDDLIPRNCNFYLSLSLFLCNVGLVYLLSNRQIKSGFPNVVAYLGIKFLLI